MGDQNPRDFAEKVIQSLKKSSRAVDLNEVPEPEPKQETVTPVVSAQSNDVQAFYAQPEGGGQGPGSGGNKDIVIIPGYTGTAATSTSQVNFYWNAPTTPDSTGIDNNVRATIYNYALSTTKPVLVFGGYDGTNQYKPTPLYGTGTGITAKIWLDPFLGRIDADSIGLNATGVGISTDKGILTYDSTQNKLRVGIGAGTAKTLAYTDDVASASGAATTAQNIHMQVGANAASHSVAFSLQPTGAGVALSSDAELTYNPNTNTLVYSNATVSGTINSTTIPTSKTLVVTTDKLSVHAATTSLELAGVISDETGSGALVFATSPTLTTPTLGVASATTINKVAFTAPATAATLTLFEGSTLATSGANSLTLTTTGVSNVTFPTAGTLITSGNKLSIHAATSSLELAGVISDETGSGALVFATSPVLVTPALGTPSSGLLTNCNIPVGNVTGTGVGVTAFLITPSSSNLASALTDKTGTGVNVFATSPTLVTPVLGVASATTINKVTFTAPATTATLTLAEGSTLVTSGANSLTLTTTAASNVTFPTAGTLITSGNKLSIHAATSSLELAGVISDETGSGALGTPSSGLLTNCNIPVGNVTGTGVGITAFLITPSSANLATAVTDETGSGALVFATNPVLVTPALGTPSSGTLTNCTIPVGNVTGTGVGVTAFLITPSSANLATALTDKTGTGVNVFATSPTLVTPVLGVASATSLAANTVRIGNAARTVDTSSGNLILDSFAGQVDINDNVVISGNLTIQGTTITVDSTVSTIVDPVIVVGSGVGGTHSTLDNNMDRGIEFRWSNAGTATTGFFGFSDTDSKFRFIPNATTAAGSNIYTGSVGTIVANFEGSFTGTITGTATTAANLNTVSTASSDDHFILFSRTNGGSGVAVSSDATLKYVPSTDNLSATSLNKVTVTAPATAATLTLANNSTLTTAGAFALTLTTTAASSVTLPTAGTLTTQGNNLSVFAATTSLQLAGVISDETGSGALVFATSPTLVTPALGTPSSGLLTNCNIPVGNVTGTGTGVTAFLITPSSANLATAVTDETGSGALVFANSPVLVTPALGTPSSGLLTNCNIPVGNVTGTGVGITAFLITPSSANLATAVTDETGSGALVFATSPTLVTPTLGVASATTINKVTFTAPATSATLTLAQGSTLVTSGANSLTLTTTAASNVTFPTAGTLTTQGNNLSVFAATTSLQLAGVISDETGSGALVFATSPVLVTPALGTPSSGLLTNCNIPVGNVTGTGVGITAFLITPSSANLATAVTDETGSGALVFATSPVLVTPALGTPSSGLLTNCNIPVGNVTGTGVGITAFLITPSSSNLATALTDKTGTGVNVFATSPTLVTPVLGVASATTINKVAFTAPATAATLTLAEGSTLVTSGANSLTLTTTGASNVTFPTTGTLATTSNKLSVFAATTSAELAGVISDETGSGALVFATSPSITTPTITSASALSAGTYLTVKTHVTDDASTTDFFIRGLTSTDVSKFSVDANGNLRATTKSFDIPHPTKEGMRLVYGVLEGPEHGVYHRGTVEGKDKITVELPEYWSKLVNEDYTVTLTAYGNYSVHIVQKLSNSFIISANTNFFNRKFKHVKVDYVVHGSRKDAPLEIEQH
jgi:hypothetical protein